MSGKLVRIPGSDLIVDPNSILYVRFMNKEGNRRYFYIALDGHDAVIEGFTTVDDGVLLNYLNDSINQDRDRQAEIRMLLSNKKALEEEIKNPLFKTSVEGGPGNTTYSMKQPFRSNFPGF